MTEIMCKVNPMPDSRRALAPIVAIALCAGFLLAAAPGVRGAPPEPLPVFSGAGGPTPPGEVETQDRNKLADRARDAAGVLDEIMSTPEKGIPESLLGTAECVAVIPRVVKIGFIVGGRHGKGLVSCRTDGGWSRPSFLSLSGGSVGLQIGAQATDFVLVFVNRRAAERLTEDKFTLGADAAVSAGPVGRTAGAGTDVKLQTEIYTYSRSRGLFAGVSLEGATLSEDRNANWEMYGDRVIPEDLLFGSGGTVPAELATFVNTLGRHAPTD